MSYDPSVAVSVSDWAMQNLCQSYIKIALRLDGHHAGEAAARKELRPLVEKAAREYGREAGDKIPAADVAGALDLSVKAYLEHKDDDYGGPRLERLARRPNPAGDRFYVIERGDEWYVADSKNDVRTTGAYTESQAHRIADEYNRKGTKIRVENPGSVREGQIVSENIEREENPLDWPGKLNAADAAGTRYAHQHGRVDQVVLRKAFSNYAYAHLSEYSVDSPEYIALWGRWQAGYRDCILGREENPTGHTGSDRLVPGQQYRVSHKARSYAGQWVEFVRYKDSPEGTAYAMVQPEGGPEFMIQPYLLIELHGGRSGEREENPASAVVRDVMHQLIHAGIDRTSVAFVAWDEDTLKVSKNLRGCLIKYNRGMDLYDVTPYDATPLGFRSPLKSKAGAGDPGSGAIWGDTVEDVGAEELREVVERMLRVGNPEENPSSFDPTLHSLPMGGEVEELIAAMNENNSHHHTPYAGYEITESRRKYHLLNAVLTNGQRSGAFLIDKDTHDVYKSRAYGQAGRKIGTVASLLSQYQEANRQERARPLRPREAQVWGTLRHSGVVNPESDLARCYELGYRLGASDKEYGTMRPGYSLETEARQRIHEAGLRPPQLGDGIRTWVRGYEDGQREPVGNFPLDRQDNPGGGYYVMAYGGGRYTSVAWYATREEADRHVAQLKASGAWSGKPPKVEASNPSGTDWMSHRALTGEDPLDVAFEAGKQWGETGAAESGVANARVRHYGFMQWYNSQAPGHLVREGPPRRKLTKSQVEKSFNEGYKIGKEKADYFYKQSVWLHKTQGRKLNPADGAAALYEEFHGVPSEQETIITEDIQYHGNLAGLGTLVEIVVKTLSGYKAVLDFEGCDVLLCSSEDGKQLYLRGGQQDLDLAAIKMNGDEWVRDSMVIGPVTHLTYRTAKKFDKLKELDYEHKAGEESGVRPELIYDVLNNALSISGGQYETKDVGIVN